LVIYQESLLDAPSTKYKILQRTTVNIRGTRFFIVKTQTQLRVPARN